MTVTAPRKIIINGLFLSRRLTGMERTARELVREMDALVDDCYTPLELAVPWDAMDDLHLRNISIRVVGSRTGTAWEQTSLARYVLRERGWCLSICSTAPLFCKGGVFIHDIAYLQHPEWFTSLYSRLSAAWHRVNYAYAARRADVLYTVSEWSKEQICACLGVDSQKVVVVPNGWQHILHVKEDEGAARLHPELLERPFFFTLCSLAPNKNLPWVVGAAKRNPDTLFVVAGNLNKVAYGERFKDELPGNMLLLGYVSDGESRWLMGHCRAFLFPSLYEGFGIPPLEALSCGAAVVVSHATALPEVLGDAVHYVDPEAAIPDLDEILAEPVGDAGAVLSRYSYSKAAEVVCRSLEDRGLLRRKVV